MRLLFLDRSGWDFDVRTPLTQPMAGTQSGLCYLAAALAQRGHDVWTVTATTQPGTHLGVHSLSYTSPELNQLPVMDALVAIQSAGAGQTLRAAAKPGVTKVILWTGDTPDTYTVQSLKDPAERDCYDGFAFVSEWQRRQYHRFFPLDEARTKVMRNAIAPVMENMFAPQESILASKSPTPALAYCSAPFRGLDYLLDAFPEIHRRVPESRLRIFSSLRMYNVPADRDQAENAARYARANATEGVEYLGSLPQPQLAPHLKRAWVLAYPCVFVETSCMVAMEAMAAGCKIVTSEIGGLPETTAGFARLVPGPKDRQKYLPAFIDGVVAAIGEIASRGAEAELRKQSDFANDNYVWGKRAQEWVKWIASLAARG